ncbi:MAG: META domain-containing protein [Dysgonamonadaceae bacterium]|jgi:heat shock protein HslJ|nr:META domain-containing protein [Dysgonamonadaceae bacterium]
MKTKLNLLFLLCAFLFACEDLLKDPLENTKWELVSFVVDGNEGTPQSIHRIGFSLKDSDNYFEGETSTNFFEGFYEINSKTSEFKVVGYGVSGGAEDEMFNEEYSFVKLLRQVYSFELRGNTLKLFLVDGDVEGSKSNYLSFKKVK